MCFVDSRKSEREVGIYSTFPIVFLRRHGSAVRGPRSRRKRSDGAPQRWRWIPFGVPKQPMEDQLDEAPSLAMVGFRILGVGVGVGWDVHLHSDASLGYER